MDLFYISTVFIILCAVVITTTAAPTSEEEVDSQGEYGEIVEGDMLMTKDQRDELYNTGIDTRNAIRATARHWPNATIVYDFAEKNFDKNQTDIIENGLSEIRNRTCLTVRHRQNNREHAVRIQSSGNGCFATPGYNEPGEQVLNLGKDCVHYRTVIHEMLHTIGFYHMHATYNRDNYVNIVWENIQKGEEHNFYTYNNITVTNYGVPYDYASIMHYEAYAFSSNGRPTIIPKKNVTIGLGQHLSEGDILKINRMYCGNTSTTEY